MQRLNEYDDASLLRHALSIIARAFSFTNINSQSTFNMSNMSET